MVEVVVIEEELAKGRVVVKVLTEVVVEVVDLDCNFNCSCIRLLWFVEVVVVVVEVEVVVGVEVVVEVDIFVEVVVDVVVEVFIDDLVVVSGSVSVVSSRIVISCSRKEFAEIELNDLYKSGLAALNVSLAVSAIFSGIFPFILSA